MELFHLSSLCQMLNDHRMVALSSLVTSDVVERELASMMLSTGLCQLLMGGHCAQHLPGSLLISSAKLLDPPLHFMFVSSSLAKCVIDVASCLG